MFVSDDLIQVHDLNFTTIHQVSKSKGATFFAVNINVCILTVFIQYNPFIIFRNKQQ